MAWSSSVFNFLQGEKPSFKDEKPILSLEVPTPQNVQTRKSQRII